MSLLFDFFSPHLALTVVVLLADRLASIWCPLQDIVLINFKLYLSDHLKALNGMLFKLPLVHVHHCKGTLRVMIFHPEYAGLTFTDSLLSSQSISKHDS